MNLEGEVLNCISLFIFLKKFDVFTRILMEIKQKPRVTLGEIGLYLRTIEIDYKPKNNAHRAELITEYFPVICLEEDVDHYEELCNVRNEIVEDYELEDRRHSYFQSLNTKNPFL